jgi:DNA-binding beta-propeller fold protein YncE
MSRSLAFVLCLAVLSTPIAAQSRPTGTVIVSNMNDHTATLIDAASGRVIATLATGEGPHEVAASHDGKWALVSNYGVRGKPGHTITVIDVARATVAKTIELGDAGRPHGMAFLPGDTIVAVTSEANKNVHLVDVRAGKVVKSLPTNGRTSHMLSVSAKGDRIVTGNIADGTISVLSLSGEPRTIPVARQPEGIAITPNGNEAWVGSNRDSLVSVVDLTTGEAKALLRGFGLPYRLVISADGKSVVITDPMRATVTIVDVESRKTRFTIDVPKDSIVATAEVPGSPSPEGVVISPDSRWAFVTLQGRNRMVTIDLGRGVIVGWAPTGTWSDGIAFSPLVARPK